MESKKGKLQGKLNDEDMEQVVGGVSASFIRSQFESGSSSQDVVNNLLTANSSYANDVNIFGALTDPSQGALSSTDALAMMNTRVVDMGGAANYFSASDFE